MTPVVWRDVDGDNVDLPLVRMSELPGNSGVVVMCSVLQAKTHFDADEYDCEQEPIVFLTETSWCKDDRVCFEGPAQVILKVGADTDVARLHMTVLGNHSVSIGGPWSVIQAPRSTVVQIVCEVLKEWSPEQYSKAEKEPAKRLDAAVATLIAGVKPTIVRPAKATPDKV